MSTAATLRTELRDLYLTESARIQEEFTASGSGLAAIAQRTELVEKILLRLWDELISPGAEAKNFALVALGGFGRRSLFPHSDVDILFLHADRGTEDALRDPVRTFCQELWDLRMKLGPTTRTLAECDQFDPQNVEFTISLLDCRFVAGDRSLFDRLHDSVLPKFFVREGNYIIQQLTEVTRSRHSKYGNTVFHLEPNIKEAPGGLRDYNVACWMALLSAMDKERAWPDPETLLPESARRSFAPAMDFLSAVRVFLHYRQGRDDNMLAWESQDEAAARRIGVSSPEHLDAAQWMRVYFRHARAVHYECLRLIESVPAARSSLYRHFQNLRSRLSNADFSVVDGLVFLQQPSAIRDPELLFRIFSFTAHHGLKLAMSTESRVQQVVPDLTAAPPSGPESWRYLQAVLTEPHAAEGLRAMHSLGLLTVLLPELKLIDSLVVRDFYHRFTVDEHSFLAIECLHRAQQSKSEWDQRYGRLLEELEKPELLYLALLLHDVGKGVPGDVSHVVTSLEVAHKCMDRLGLEQADREVISFLIGSHLEISSVLRRDIYDPATIQGFTEKMGTPERLKMLCLLTYADIKAVNPDALTPWKAENVWQLYIAAANTMSRTADQRLHADAEKDETVARLQVLAPKLTRKITPFLEGLPKRYLRTYRPEEMLRHLEMTGKLSEEPVQLHLERGRHWFELTLVTQDRPFLFAKLAGSLAAWGMNIVKADAFSNAAGVVVDTFFFTDRFRTLELNLPEWGRFQRSIADVLNGEADLERMLRDRLRSEKQLARIKVPTRVEFDDESSASSTLVQVVAQDRLGLLNRICSRFSHRDCNIEIALIDTEGQMAIDVFYLTSSGAKLPAAKQEELKADLLEELQVA